MCILPIFLVTLAVTLACTVWPVLGSVSPSAKKCLIWGPGLKPSFNVPARYFYVQAVDKNGENITTSIGEKPFEINFETKDGTRARIRIDQLDRQDGSYIVRYRMYSSHSDLKLSVRWNGFNVGASPYQFNGDVYHEKCECPIYSSAEWMKVMECPASYAQIERDLALFPKIDMLEAEKKIVEQFNRPGSMSICHYVIKDNRIYRKTHGKHVGFKMFMDAILLSMTRKYKLPDLEFVVNLGDWPLVKKNRGELIPMLSWCGSEETHDIIMPTYDITESTLETMGRVSLELLSIQGNTGPRWENKKDQAFWRGRDSRRERLDLIDIARHNPDLIDARITNWFFFKDQKEKYGGGTKHVSFFDFFQYKYQLNIDGTVAAYRFPYLLAGDSLVFKQDSNYYEHFYKDLTPMEHYVPVKHDLSDLKDKLLWAKSNPEKAKQISENGSRYARENLLGQDIYCYHALLFKEYAKRLTSIVEVREGMEEVIQEKNRDTNCDCPLSQQKRDEL